MSTRHVGRPALPKRPAPLLALLDATLNPNPDARPEVSHILALPFLAAAAARRKASDISPHVRPHM
eukprot:3434733-Rhodomonas_salina.1